MGRIPAINAGVPILILGGNIIFLGMESYHTGHSSSNPGHIFLGGMKETQRSCDGLDGSAAPRFRVIEPLKIRARAADGRIALAKTMS